MKQLIVPVMLIAAMLAGCSQEPQEPAQNPNAQVSQAAAPGGAPSGDTDAVLMAEYLLFTHLADSLVYQPMFDTAAMVEMVSKMDLFSEGGSTRMMKGTAQYMYDIFNGAILPIQQFGGNARSAEVQAMAEQMVELLQQTSNQYFRAVKVLEEAGEGAATPEQMQQVGLILSQGGATASKFRFSAQASMVYAAAHRTLGH